MPKKQSANPEKLSGSIIQRRQEKGLPVQLRLLFALAMLVSTPLYALDFRPSPAVDEVFSKAKVKGTFVLYDVSKQQLIGHDQKRAETRFIPASTFKIANSLIGLHTGVVSSVDEVFYHHDGKPKMLKAWEQDMGMREAIKTSNAGAFQVLARRIGLSAMQDNIHTLNYGNGDIGKSVDTFWLDGPLKISAVEQTSFLARLAQGQLPYPSAIQAEVRDAVKLEATENWVLYGKTGWTNKDQPGIGWFVGWVEQGGNTYSFALNINVPQDNVPPELPSALSKRLEITKASLRALDLLQPGAHRNEHTLH